MDIFHDTGTWHLQGSKFKTLIFSQPFVSLNCRCFGGYWFITPHYVSVVVFFQCCSEGLIFFGVFDSLAWLRQMDICDAFWGCWYLKFQQLPPGMYCSNPWNNGNNYLSTGWLDFNSISFCLPFWNWKHNWRVRDWNVTLLPWNVFVLLNLESAPHFQQKYPIGNIRILSYGDWNRNSWLNQSEVSTFSRSSSWKLTKVYFYPYLGRWSILTNIFQMGWCHELGMVSKFPICWNFQICRCLEHFLTLMLLIHPDLHSSNPTVAMKHVPLSFLINNAIFHP